MTEWKPIVGYEDLYEVSNCGQVRALAREVWRKAGVTANGAMRSAGVVRLKGKMLSVGHAPTHHGYGGVELNKDGKGKTFYVHALVCRAFHGEGFGRQVRHIDGDPANNSVENLCWGSAKDNADDRDRHGRTKRHERHPRARLTWEDVGEVRRRCGSGESQRSVGRDYGLKQGSVSNIVRRIVWQEIRR